MQKFAIPLAIVVAGLVIAVAVFFVNQGATSGAPTPPGQGQVQTEIRGVEEDDHIKGNPNAQIVIVEYSDTECPFCKQFHSTMNRLIAEYGPDGRVAWVYRNFPLAQIHPKAVREAVALECAAEVGGNNGFWAYTDLLYEVTPSNNGFDLDQLPVLAEQVGLDVAAFNACMESDTAPARVQEDVDEVVAAGGRGTPHTIILVGGEQIPVEGGQPYEVMKGLIDTLLADPAETENTEA